MGRKRREYTYDDWKKAMDLHNKYKLGYRRISRILGIKENTVKNWLYKGVVPLLARWIAETSKELAYIIGIIHGDGSVSKSKNKSWYRYIIELATIDKEFAEVFSKVMAKLLSVNYHKPYWSEKERKWRVTYRSKAFYLWYKRTEEQGLEGFKEYIECSKETVKYYLRGLYDSEGYNYKNKRICLYNTKKQLLKYIQYLLNRYYNVIAGGPCLVHKAGSKIVINGIETRYKHDYYYIFIGKKQHVRRFLEEIGFTIVRKQLGLRRHEKVFVEGRYVQPFELIKLGLFKLPFSDTQ